MKRAAESSAGSHRAGNGPQRARINTQHSNDGDGKLGLLFADGDKMRSSLRRQLVLDKRPSLHSRELPMFVQEFEADIAIAADCEPLDLENFEIIPSGRTNWQVWCNPKSCKISQLQKIDLIPGMRHALSMMLQRSTSCGETLRVVAIKTLKGSQRTILYFSLTTNVKK